MQMIYQGHQLSWQLSFQLSQTTKARSQLLARPLNRSTNKNLAMMPRANIGFEIESLFEMLSKISIFNYQMSHGLELKLDDKRRVNRENMLPRSYYGQLRPTRTNWEGLMNRHRCCFVAFNVPDGGDARKGGQTIFILSLRHRF